MEGTWLVFRVEVQMGAEMREKIVFILRNPLLTLDQRVEQLRSLLIEEIKKVENPYKDFKSENFVALEQGFEEARQAFLKKMEEK